MKNQAGILLSMPAFIPDPLIKAFTLNVDTLCSVK